jgi:gliding motility-associated-like protein
VSTLAGHDSIEILIDTVPGTYTYSLLAVKDKYNCNQAQNGGVTIVVDPSPTAVSSGSITVCINTNVTIGGASASNGSIGWTGNGSGVLTNTTSISPSYSTVAADAGKAVLLTMTVTSTNSCNPATATGTFTIYVDSIPAASAGGSTTICEGNSAVISGTSSKYGSISWAHDGQGTLSPNPTTVLTPTYTSVSGDAGKTITLTMTVTSTNGCSSKSTQAFYTIIVDSLPLSVSGNSTTICQNASYTLQPGEAFAKYGSISWSALGSGTGSITNGNSLTPIYAATAADAGKAVVLTMTVTSTNSCASRTATATYTINIDNLPKAAAGWDTTICQNSVYTIPVGKASQMYGSPLWTENGAGSITAGANSLTPTYSAAAGDVGNTVTLTMTVTSTNTCNPQTATALYTIEVDSLPFASSGGNIAICQNGNYTLNSGEAQYSHGTIQWTSNGQGSIDSGTDITDTPGYTAAAGDAGKTVTLTMIVTSDNTCNPQKDTAFYNIKVDSLPIAKTSIAGSTICEKDTVTVFGASSKNGSILWTAGGATGTIVAGTETTLSPKYVPTSGDVNHPVILTMTVTSTNACVGYIAQAMYTVNVDPIPVASSASSQAICSNMSAIVNGASYLYGDVSWTSDGAGGITSGGNGPTPTYTAALADGGKTVTLTMTVISNNTCYPRTATAFYPITVHPLPTATIAGSVTVCQGESPKPAITFNATGGGTVAPYTFSYQINANGVVTNKKITAPVNSIADSVSTVTAGNYVYTLQSVQDSNTPACSNAQSGTAKVTVNRLPTATIGDSAVRCQNDPKQPTITFTGYGGTTPYTFTYEINSIPAPAVLSTNGSKGFVVASTADSGTFKYKLTGVSYNKGKVCFNKQDSIIPIRINPLPTAVMSGGNDVCKDSASPVLYFKGAIGKRPYSFTFNVNNGKNTTIFSLPNTDSVNLAVRTDQAGTFNYTLVEVKDSLNCPRTINSNPVLPVVVYDNPYPSFQVNPEVTTILDPTINITNNSLGGDIYQWTFGDKSGSPSKDPESHTYADTGHYRIKLLVINNFGCKDSTYQQIIIEQPYLLYIPNTFSPNDDGVNDVFLARGDGIIKFKMMIFDRWGNMIFYSDDINKGWDGKANGGSTPAQIDAYVYLITGTDLKKHDHTYRGAVNLIR